LGKIEAVRHNVRDFAVTRVRHLHASVRIEEVKAVVNRLTGALVRAFLVMVLIIAPSVILPGMTTDTKQMVALVALFAGALTFVEYKSTYPGLIEFRDAPPFNRIRYLMLFSILFFLTLVSADQIEPTAFTRLTAAVAVVIGGAMDFPYSPVRLATLLISPQATAEEVMLVRASVGFAYFLSLVALAFFVITLKLVGWPARNQSFNVWINLPTFDPSSGGDVVERMERDARINLALGFLLPFLVPAVIKVASLGFAPVTLSSPLTLIWTIAAWAFLPASLLMRGIAMSRIADMIRQKRQLNGGQPSSAYFPA
jgi:hypothetical protein